MFLTRNENLSKKQVVFVLMCIAMLCLTVSIFISTSGKVKVKMFYELVKVASILGYVKIILYVRCLIYIRTEDSKNINALYVILFAWLVGDIIDAIDGPIARYTNTASSFGEKLDHKVIDVFRKPFSWMVLSTLYPEFMIFWQVLLLRMFIKEDEKFQLPRVPILPFINVAWYIPVIVVLRYKNVPNNICTKLLKLYFACMFITWGLEGDSKHKIRLDLYIQCYALRQEDVCESIWQTNITHTHQTG